MGVLSSIRYGFGSLVSYVHEDTGEFLKAAADPTYVEKKFREPLATNSAERAAQAKAAKDYTYSVVNHIAPNVETTKIAAVNTAVGAGVAAATLATGGAAAPLLGLTGTTAVTAGMATTAALTGVAAAEINQEFGWVGGLQLNEGEAPLRTPSSVFSPFSQNTDRNPITNFVIGSTVGFNDPSYKKGVPIDSHPVRQEYLASRNPPPAAPTFFGSLQTAAQGFFDMLTKQTGLPFGIGSLIGAAVGIIAMIFTGGPSLLSGVLLLGGLLGGQYVADQFNAEKKPVQNVAPPSQPATNHPRQAGDDPSPNASPSATIPAPPQQTTVTRGS